MEATVMTRESVVRGEVLNVWWMTLVVHVLVLDCRVLLSSSGLAEWHGECLGLVFASDHLTRLEHVHVAQSWIYALQPLILLFNWLRNHSGSSCMML